MSPVYPALILGDIHLDEGTVETVVDIMQGVGEAFNLEIRSLERHGRRIQYFRAPLGKLKEKPLRGNIDRNGPVMAQMLLQMFVGTWVVDGGIWGEFAEKGRFVGQMMGQVAATAGRWR